jgi:hypothetical protein
MFVRSSENLFGIYFNIINNTRSSYFIFVNKSIKPAALEKGDKHLRYYVNA